MKKTIALLLLAGLAGCDLEAEVEADQVCVTQPIRSSQIPGAPVAGPVVDLPADLIPVTFGLDLGDAIPDLDEKGVEASLPAQSIGLTSTEGIDLSVVERASFVVSAPSRAPVTFTYVRPAGATGPIAVVAATPETPIDLVDYLAGQDTLQLSSISVRTRLPQEAWTPALRTCAASKITLDYVEAAGL